MRFHRTVRGADIVLELLPMGEDWAIILSGGEAPHLGGVAAVFRDESGAGESGAGECPAGDSPAGAGQPGGEVGCLVPDGAGKEARSGAGTGRLDSASGLSLPDQPGLTPETLSGPGHRDAELAAQVAGIVARATCRSVAVLCGIHYDAATKDEIAGIVAACLSMMEECLSALTFRHSGDS